MQNDLRLQEPLARGYAAILLPEDRQALIETLTQDISLHKGKEKDFTVELMLRALEDAKGV